MPNAHAFAGTLTPGAATAQPAFRRLDGTQVSTPWFSLFNTAGQWLPGAANWATTIDVAAGISTKARPMTTTATVPWYTPPAGFADLPVGYYWVMLAETDTLYAAVESWIELYWDGTTFYSPEQWAAQQRNVVLGLEAEIAVHESRIWVVDRKDGEVRGSHTVIKDAAEALEFAADFGAVLVQGEIITSVDELTVDMGDVTLSTNPSDEVKIIAGRYVQFRASEGYASTTPDRISLKVTTNGNNEINPYLLMQVT